MALYSSRSGRWSGRYKAQPSHPEPVRDEREWHTDLGNGLVRVDIGSPIKPVHGSPKPTLAKDSRVPAPAPEQSLEVALGDKLPADLRKPVRDSRDFKPGIGKD